MDFLRDMDIDAASLKIFQGYCQKGLKGRQRLLAWQREQKVDRDIEPALAYMSPHKFMRCLDTQYQALRYRLTQYKAQRYRRMQDLSEACYEYQKRQNDDNGSYEASLKARLKEVEGKLANIIKAIEKGIFGDAMAEQINVLESQKSMLNDALLAEQNRRKFDLKQSDILRFLDSFVGALQNA